MGYSSKTTRKMLKELARDYDKYQRSLFTNLVSQTPIDTGQAQRGWKNVTQMSDVIGTGKTKVVIRNDVPYIERLDGNPGWSGQAPKGIVKPVLARVRKP